MEPGRPGTQGYDEAASVSANLQSAVEGNSEPGNSEPGNSEPGNSEPENSEPENSEPENSEPRTRNQERTLNPEP